MIRFIKAVAVTAAFFMIPAAASAVSVSIVGVTGPGAGGVLEVGDTVTFDLVVENNAQDVIFGLGVTVSGYDSPDTDGTRDSNIRLLDGQVAGFALGFDPGDGSYLNARENVLATAVETWEPNLFAPRAYETQLFQGADTSATIGTGQLDTGVDGNTIANGGVHFRVTFVNIPNADLDVIASTLEFNVAAIGQGGVVLPSTGDSFYLTAIPEPGTALLMGLGLVGLAGRRR